MASASTSCRISGSTAPSSMAVRTDCSASSGLAISAGGGRWPMRCSAASTSPITARRPSSDLRMLALVVVERLEPRFGRRDLRFDVADAAGGVDQVLVELAAVGADLLDLALERGLGLDRLALRIARGLEVLVALLERVELFGLVGLPACARLNRALLRRAPRRRARSAIRAPAPRQARSADRDPPKANHCSHVTPAGWDGKTDCSGQSHCRPD